MNMIGGMSVSSGSFILEQWLHVLRGITTQTDTFTSLSADLVGVGAGRAGEETETEEQAGAGHRHNGPDQLRTIQHLHLLLFLHSSSPSVSPTRSSQPNNKTPTPNNTTDELQKGQKQYTAKLGEGVRQRWAGLCTLTCVCVCVCLQPRTVCGLVSAVWGTGTPDDFTQAYMEKHVNWQHLIIVDVGVCRLLDFDFRSFVVITRWSGKKQWKPGKRTLYMASLAGWTNLWRANGERLSRSCDSNGCHSFKGC